MNAKDLFGNDLEEIDDPAKEELENFDTKSFEERLKRLRYINTIFPFGRREYASDEAFRLFNEAIQSYIFGLYVSTIILSQAFIERRIQDFFHANLDEKRPKLPLSKLLREFKTTGFIDDYFIERIDRLRLKRNPFVHHKKINDNDTLRERAQSNNLGSEAQLELDAKEAISLMLVISRFPSF